VTSALIITPPGRTGRNNFYRIAQSPISDTELLGLTADYRRSGMGQSRQSRVIFVNETETKRTQ